ncbi:MAG: hypothetical protein WD691_01075 [Acidimicrobiales bacterium]
MSAIGFLLIVLVVSVVGSFMLWLQHRSPSTLESGIEAFHREMEALAPPDGHPPDSNDDAG